jgi:N-glycosylase/DNA lyase
VSTDLSSVTTTFTVAHYDLDTTLGSGQSFRWQKSGSTWIGVIGKRWVRLQQIQSSITATVADPVCDWNWLVHYLQLDIGLEEIVRTFPDDQPMQAALRACRGLRLLRQDPWECLASFILSSTKQIVQIQQIIALLTERFGEPLPAAPSYPRAFSFPAPERLSRCTETELRECKMGFRAPYLLETARTIVSGRFDLQRLSSLPLGSARAELMSLPGVGRKIADCVLLFAYGFPAAFPVDVWVIKALRELYFPRTKRAHLKRLRQFSEEHFGPHGGYAQQYLFHYMRTKHPASTSRKQKGKRPAEKVATRNAKQLS